MEGKRFVRGYLLAIVGVITLGAAIFLVLVQRERYALVAQNGEGKFVYKLDKATGRVWYIWETFMFEVDDRSARKMERTPEDEAIGLAELYTLPGNTSAMDVTIKQWLQQKKGPLRVQGWNAKKIDDQTYLVGYTYDEGPGSSGGAWVFEVNLKAQIVRNVIGDADLEKKYADWAQSLQRGSNPLPLPR